MSTPNPDQYQLRILGAPDLRAPDGRRLTSVLSQPSRLSLLAYLALAPDPVTRASVVADFWPESDEARARNALSQALFYLRRSLGKSSVTNVEGDRLWVPPERVWCDARVLLLEDDPPEDVVESAAEEELLAGWNAEASQPLQDWLDGTRRRVRERAAAVREGAGRAGVTEGATETPASARPRRGDAGEARDGPEAAARGSHSPTPSRPGGLARWLPWVAGLAAVVLAAWVAWTVLPSGDLPEDAAAAPARQAQLAVLMPRVIVSAGAPELSALTVNAEVLARLARPPGLQVVSAGSASSAQELLGQLEAIGADQAGFPDWILAVTVIVTDEQAHVNLLLYRGPGLEVARGVVFDEALTGPDAVSIGAPRAVAERAASLVGEVVGP